MTLLAVLPFRLGGRTTAFASLGMLQIGEFSYVRARVRRDAGAISDGLNSLILTASLVTIVLTPAAFWLAPRAATLLERLPFARRAFVARASTVGAADALDRHAIVVGYGRIGRYVAAGLREQGLTVTVIEEDLHLVRELERESYFAIYGDASHPSVLAAAHPDRARLVVVALPDAGSTRAVVQNAHRANPSAPLLARVAHADQDAVLRRAGATAVIAPERAGAILLLEESARALRLSMPAAEDRRTGLTVQEGATSRDRAVGATEEVASIRGGW